MAYSIEVIWQSGSGIDHGVTGHRMDGQDLVVDYQDGSQETYPFGNAERVA